MVFTKMYILDMYIFLRTNGKVTDLVMARRMEEQYLS
jgi:hypothetical protein